MPPQTRLSSIVTQSDTGPTGKQTPIATIAAKGKELAKDPPLPEEETDYTLLLDILANQKAVNKNKRKDIVIWITLLLLLNNY